MRITSHTRIQILFLMLLIGLLPLKTSGQYSRKELRLGAETFETIKKTKGFYQNKLLQAWVEQIGRSLELHIEKHYNFSYYLVDDPEPNAFATTGGYIYINRGLLVYINTPDELAGILSHELSHVTHKHVKKRVSARIIPNLLQLPANIIGLLTYKEAANIINAPIKAASDLVTSAYNRTQEFEADQLGINLAIKAGYDPYGLMDVLRRLNYSKHDEKKSLFMDHPLTIDRIRDMNGLLHAKGIERTQKIPGTFINFLDGLNIGQNPANGLLNGNVFIHPTHDLYFELPPSWIAQVSPHFVNAFSPDKKSTLVVSMEVTDKSPFQAAIASLRELKKSELLDRGPVNINGLNGYKASTLDKRVKYEDLVTDIMWLKIPSSNTLLKIVAISEYSNSETDHLDSFDTFRTLSEYDKSDFNYAVLKLKKAEPNETLEEFAKRKNISWQLRSLQNMNDLKPEDTAPTIKFLKTISIKELE